jgi:hypothetical protein
MCEYLRLLEKKKKKKKNSSPRAKSTALGEGGAQPLWGYSPLPRAEGKALNEDPPLHREPDTEPDIWFSVKSPSSTRVRYLALGEEPIFNESQIFGSRRRSGPHS